MLYKIHYKAFFTFKKEIANTSEEARGYVIDFLTEQEFCSQGFFSQAPADWFVVGGRWSGELQNINIQDEVMKMLQDKGKPKEEHLYESDIEKNKEEIQNIWKENKGEGVCPYLRDSYKDEGYEDDAMIITKEIYNKFLKEYEGDCSDGEGYWDLEQQEVNNDFIGNKWIVVVDYHN